MSTLIDQSLKTTMRHGQGCLLNIYEADAVSPYRYLHFDLRSVEQNLFSSGEFYRKYFKKF